MKGIQTYRNRFILAAMLFVLLLSTNAYADWLNGTITAGTSPYAIVVNPNTNKIYVPNYGSNTVTVINGADNTTATVTAGTNPYAVAVNPNTNKIYVTNYNSANVTVIDGTDNTTATVAAGTSPYAIAVNPNTNKIYVANSGSNTVTVINGADNTTATVATGTGPHAIAVNPNTNKIYVANYDSNNVTVINGTNESVAATVAAGTNPWAVAVNPNTNKIYVTNVNSSNVTVINGADNTTATVAAGTSPWAVAVNPNTNKIYVANANSANVTVINGADNTTATVAAGTNLRAVAVSPNTNKIYVTNYGSNNVTVINGADNTTATVAAGTNPWAVVVNPNTNKIYVTNYNSANVTVIDGTDNTTATVTVWNTPELIGVNSNTNKIYVANYGSNKVTVINGTDESVAATVTTGSGPYSPVVNPITNKIYVTNLNSNNVTVINGADNTTTTVAAGNTPYFIGVNPNTNKIYVTNYGSNKVTVINGTDESVAATVTAGSAPYEVAVNPNTNKIYVSNYNSNNVTVINGADNTTATVTAGTGPYAVGVNPNTNKIYVSNVGSNNVTVINGADNTTSTVTAGTGPYSLNVNRNTNKIYVANLNSNNVTVINGADNTTATVDTGNHPERVVVNPNTNKIYTSNWYADNVTEINGADNTTTAVSVGSNPSGIAVNPNTNKIYVSNYYGNSVSVIKESTTLTSPLTDTITAFSSDTVTTSTPLFAGTAATTRPATLEGVLYQVDTTQGPWQTATLIGSNWSGTQASALTNGLHTVYAVPFDNTNATECQMSDPSYLGNIAAYQFLVNVPAYTITATAAANGIISPSGAVTVSGGNNQTLTVSANSGYYISNIKVDSISLTVEAFGSTYSYTFEAVSANHTIQASFEVSGRKVWDGGGTTNYWKDQNNWTGNATPEVTDTATFDSTSLKVCTIDAAATVANFFLSSAYTSAISQAANLTVTSTFTQEGTGKFICVAPQTYAFTAESFSISNNSGTFMRFIGAGTSGSPYFIYDVFGLQAMKQYLNNASINFKLNQNIDAAITSAWNGGAGFVPVGLVGFFNGKFYGNNKTISGLYINRPSTDYIGLFGYTYGSTIQDIGMVGGSVTGHNYVGGLVGENYLSIINNSYATGNVTGNPYTGGLVGHNNSSAINNSYSTGNVTCNTETAGGLVGYNNNSSTINNCYAAGNIVNTGTGYTGGLAGRNGGSSTISNSYATGSVTGGEGGLVGWNSSSTISNCYATGAISGGNVLGGLVGVDNGGTIITNSYYDANTTGQSDTDKGTPETTAQMKNKYTFSGWDWDNTWGIKNGQAYPTLQWQGHIWYGGADTNWSTSGNWNKSSVPGATDMVYFNSSSTSDATADTSFGGSIAGLSLGAGYANTVTLGKNLSIGNDIYQNAGTLSCASYTVTISGGISHEAGTFTDGTGTVTFIDATRTSTIEGNTTFNNLTCATAGKILTFEASQITTAEGVLTLTGSAGNLITLRSTSGGTQWKINPSGTRSVSYVDVKDSNNINATVIGPTSSTNSGNNTNWFSIYTLTSEVIGSNGTIAPSGTVPSEGGINNTYTITANSGYYIRDIKVDSISLTGEAFGSTYPYTFEAVSANHTIQASFEVNGLKVWNGGGTTNYWKDQNNWTGNATPEVTDTATFDSTSQKVCTIDAAATVANFFLSSAYTGTVSQNANLAVTATFTQEGLGTFECAAPQTYTFTSESFSISTNSGTFMRFTGAGTAGSPYMIYDVFALQSMKQYLNNTNINFKLSQNIDAAITSHWDGGAGFVPVGNGGASTPFFKGKFYGNSKTINGLSINRPSTDNVGLFGYASGSTIQDIGMVGSSVSGRSYVGGLVGFNYYYSPISNSYATGSVSGSSSVGGLVGYNHYNCPISNSYGTGSVSGTADAGGLVGYNYYYSPISNSYATGSVSCTGDDAGGLVGDNNSYSPISNSYATGSVSCAGDDAGGLVGNNYYYSPISNSYGTGSVNGNNDAGGLVGDNNASNTISNSYATGTVSGAGVNSGGLVGVNTSSSITGSYYCGSPNNSIGTYETPAQLKQKATFLNWDFKNIWLIDENKNYPYHTWEAWNTPPAGWTTLTWKKNLIVQGGYPQTNNDKVFIGTGESTAVLSGVVLGGLHLGTGAGTVTLSGTLTLDNAGTREGTLAIHGGALNASSYTISIDGNFTRSAGTFTQGTGTVSFESTTPSSIEGNTTFNNLTCATAGKVLTFEASNITTAEGVLTLTGSAGNLVTLRSTSDGTQWKINPSGTRSVSYVDVKDSNNINAAIIDPSNSTNSGNNTNWFQTAPAAPTNFVPTSESTTALHYTWTDNATNESGFRILDGSTNAVMVSVASGETATSESGLAANTQYSIKIQVYNNAGAATSDAASKYTSIEAAAGGTYEGITDVSITVHASNAPSNLAEGLSGIYFQNTTAETDSGWIKSNTWTSSGLTASTAYNFKITTRNGDGVITTTTDAGSQTTLTTPTPEAPSNFSSVSSSGSSLNYYWTDNSTSEAGFRILDATNEAVRVAVASGTTSTFESGFAVNTQYSRKVQAYNASGASTSAAVSRYTSIEASTGGTFEGITMTEITVHSLNGPTNLVTGESGLMFKNTTNTTDSTWIKTNTWAQTGLATNTAYSYTITARNGDGVITTTTDAGSKYTSIEAASGISWESVGSRTITAHASNEPAGLSRGSSGIYFEITSPITDNSGWIKTNAWTNSSLSPNTAYTFKAVTRNGDGVLTATVEGIQSTTAIPPTPEAPTHLVATAESTGQIRYTWTDTSTNESGFRVLDENNVEKASVGSGVTTVTESSLLANKQYSRKVQAYNETGAATSEIVLRYTSIEAASALTLEGQTKTSMTVHASSALSNLVTGESGVLFQNTTSSTDSGWIRNNTWAMTGLATNQAYSIKITTRNGNGVIASTFDAGAKYTSIEAATGASWEGITTTSITIHASNEPSNLSSASSGMYFENVSEGTNSGWIKSNTWMSSGLTIDTAYSFRITTRNGDGVMAATLDAGSKRTSPEEPVYIPSADAYSNIFTSKISANWKANGNPDGTLYYCENTVSGNNSGWITLLTWKDSGLTASTVYAFRVKAKSSLGTQSEWADLGRQETKGLSTFSSIKENGVNLLNNDIVKSKPALEIRTQSTSDILTSTFKTWIDDRQITDGAAIAGGYDSTTGTGSDVMFQYTPKTALDAAFHKIKFEVYDDAGTIFREERTGLQVRSDAGITGAVLSYPNPADPSKGPVKISYTLNTDSSVVLYLFDTSGRMVWKQNYSAGVMGGKAGYNEVVWDGKDIGGMTLPNDVYLLRVMDQSSGRVLGKSKIVILRSSSAKPDINSFAGIIGLTLLGLVGIGGIVGLRRIIAPRKK